MNRFEFRKRFKTVGPAVLAVIHALDRGQVVRNAKIAAREGAHGVFLINHDFAFEGLLPLVRQVRDRFPSLWLGVNFLGVTGARAFPVLGDLERSGCVVDAYWADDARIDEHAGVQREAEAIAEARRSSGWSGLYLGGTAFKKQRPVQPEEFEAAARIAARHMDAVTTSGVATGHSAEVPKIEAFRAGCADQTLAVASGVTPDNAAAYAGLVDAVLVATGINRTGDFYNIEPVRLRRLLAVCREAGAGEPEPNPDAGWYLPLMAPNVKGERFAWLDPSTIYINARAFHALVDDLIAPFDPSGIDVVAGFDAMGFVLGSAIATRLGKGFLTIRKAGKVPVETDVVDFVNYSRRTQRMEMRKPAFAPGTRVLLVDQWVETGGTMDAGIRLVERQGGVVAGIATVCIEENEGGAVYRGRYRCSTAVIPGTAEQDQCNRKTMDHFAAFDPARYFPEIPERP